MADSPTFHPTTRAGEHPRPALAAATAGVVASPWLQVRCDTVGLEVAVGTLCGELDAGTLPVLERAFAQIEADPRVCSVVLDLSAVTFCSITGAAWFLRAAGRAAVARREFVVVLKTAAARRAFELTGADREIPWYATCADALEAARAWPRVAAAVAQPQGPTAAPVS